MDNNNGQIQVTTNYDQFKFMNTNRDVDRQHVNTLVKAIAENPQLAASQPVLVNEHMQVIDGQHRLSALRELGMPVYYLAVSGLTSADARAINVTQKGWVALDYAKSYANSGNPNYQRYLQLREEYPMFAHFITLLAIHGGQPQGMFVKFRTGRLEINEDQMDTIRERADKFVSIIEASESKSSHILRAIVSFFDKPGYDHERMTELLKEFSGTIPTYGTAQDYQRALEALFNYRRHTVNHVRLY